MIDTVFINGTVGAGKSTLAEALSEHERELAHAHAVIDIDDIRRSWPTPQHDPFNNAVELQNLEVMCAVYRRSGAERLILAGVIEHAVDVPKYTQASGSSDMLVCRLGADIGLLRSRLAKRHAGDEQKLNWYLHRVGELADILEREDLDDVVLDSGAASPAELATALAGHAGWN